jgi:hypothetical protein
VCMSNVYMCVLYRCVRCIGLFFRMLCRLVLCVCGCYIGVFGVLVCLWVMCK